MPLTIEQIREIIAAYDAVTSVVFKSLTFRLDGYDERGEQVSYSHKYMLEGLYPEKETSSDIIPENVERLCSWCDKPLTVDDGVLCANCQTSYDDDSYDD